MEFLITFVNGLSLGGIYAMIALGYTMVYGIAKMLNFAHGDIIMVGGYTILVFLSFHPLAAILAAVLPGGEVLSVQETVEGRVGYEMKGENGFGYDPFFYVPEYGCTTAEMTPSQKNEISHRGKALRSMCRKLEEQVK